MQAADLELLGQQEESNLRQQAQKHRDEKESLKGLSFRCSSQHFEWHFLLVFDAFRWMSMYFDLFRLLLRLGLLVGTCARSS